MYLSVSKSNYTILVNYKQVFAPSVQVTYKKHSCDNLVNKYDNMHIYFYIILNAMFVIVFNLFCVVQCQCIRVAWSNKNIVYILCTFLFICNPHTNIAINRRRVSKYKSYHI